jgi:hypothetical protein
MAALEWEEVLGQKFSGEEARDASDFGEILFNHALEMGMAFRMFRDQDLSVGKRLFFAVKASEDDIAFMLMRETDTRLCEVIKRRLANARLEQNGGIVC